MIYRVNWGGFRCAYTPESEGILKRSFRYVEVPLYGNFGKSLIKHPCEANGNAGDSSKGKLRVAGGYARRRFRLGFLRITKNERPEGGTPGG